MALVFNIKNLTCEYNTGEPVIEIKDLQIPTGKLVFVVGKSGIGKSTFIETLGFMNRTFTPNDDMSIGYSKRNSKTPTELKKLWKESNEVISLFRKENFSFIFQNTNLMPNFTSGENMMFSLLIQNKTIDQSKAKVLEVMNLLSLSPDLFDKKITALSGGQRQRLAFVRAITAEFNVLFGDEPTGNLDEKNASELMIVLKNILIDENKTGIIVSHNIELALTFADIIIPITSKPTIGHNQIGEIKRENMLYRERNQWQHYDKVPCESPSLYINNFLLNSPIEA